MGSITASIQGHAGSVNYTVSFTSAAADVGAAQTILNNVKTFLSGGSTIDSVSGTFTPASTSLT